MVSAGSGATTLGVPSSAGVCPAAVADTLTVAYNDLAATAKLFDQHGGKIAAMLVEPVAGNMGVVAPAKGYLQGLRDLCTRHGAMLILDEVMTGFRVAMGGAQTLYGVQPDLTTLGKIIGGGMPVGAIGGRAEIMDLLAPLGPVYQAGTLSGNPVAMAAGLATLQEISAGGFYEQLESRSVQLEAGLLAGAREAGLAGKVTLNRVGSMMTFFFAPPPVSDYATATASDTREFAAFFQAMLEGGIYLPPSQFEAIFVSAAHSDADIARTCEVAAAAFRRAAANR